MPLGDYKVDHLILLVGGNPLPNYVAAQMLTHAQKDREQTHIHLVHTATKGMDEVRRQLKKLIKSKVGLEDRKIIEHEVDKSSSLLIEKAIKPWLPNLQGRVGLHYTGGTKAMAAHILRLVKQHHPQAICSYLDAESLTLCVDGNLPNQNPYVGDAVRVSLDEMCALHNYEWEQKPKLEGRWFELAALIAKVHSTKEGVQAWKDCYPHRSNKSHLPRPAQFPALESFLTDLERLFGATPTPELVVRKLDPNWTSLNSAGKWLTGEWLEEHVLQSLKQIESECELTERLPSGEIMRFYGMSGKPRKTGRKHFELDVAAVRGYQLFAISCITASDEYDGARAECKKHLLEIYVRARQIGGDEANIALVCCVEDAAGLQQEINEEWMAEGTVRVFGRSDLCGLPDKLKGWLLTAHQKRS